MRGAGYTLAALILRACQLSLLLSACIFPIDPLRAPSDAGTTPDSGTQCGAGLADCDGNGSCETDVVHSTEACGRCRHSCLGGTCSGGVCGAVTLAQDQHTPGGIAIAAGQAYWVSDDDAVIRQAAATLPGAVDVAPTDTGPISLTANGDALFWTTPGSGTVQGLDPVGGAVTTYAFNQSISWGYPAADGDAVYWCDVDAGAVRKASRSTRAVTLVATSPPPHSVVLAPAPVWTSDQDGVFTLATDGGTRLLNDAGITPTHLAIYRGRAIVCETVGNAVSAIDLTTGQRTVLSATEVNVHGIAADSAGVFWATDTQLMTYDDDGGVRVFADFPSVHRIALTADAVYWTEFTGAVRRLAR
jgi:hypothetical protein